MKTLPSLGFVAALTLAGIYVVEVEGLSVRVESDPERMFQCAHVFGDNVLSWCSRAEGRKVGLPDVPLCACIFR